LGSEEEGCSKGFTQWCAWIKYKSGKGNLAARPGHSNHGLGAAVDIENCSKGSSVHSWLVKNAKRFNFYPLASESWHWDHGSAKNMKLSPVINTTGPTSNNDDDIDDVETSSDMGSGQLIAPMIFDGLKENINKIKTLMNQPINESLNNGSKLGEFTIISDNTPKGHGGRTLGNWQSDNAWDLKAPIGTSVYSFTNGVVSRVKQSKPGNPKIFGTQISIKGKDGNPDIFYTHLEGVKLNKGDEIKIGDYVGKITKWESAPEGSHVHVGLPFGNDLGDLISKNKIDVQTFKLNGHDSNNEKKSEDSEIDDFLSNVNDTSSDMGSGQLIAPLLFGDLKEEVNRIKTLMIK